MIPYEKPHYKLVPRLPFIPFESEIDMLIGGVGAEIEALRLVLLHFLNLFFDIVGCST